MSQTTVNESGIHPVGWRVLVKPIEVEETTASGIIISTGETKAREQMANTTGTVIEVGSGCNDWCKAGDKVVFGKYSGLVYTGKDKVGYRLLNDEDVVAVLDSDLNVVDPHLSKV